MASLQMFTVNFTKKINYKHYKFAFSIVAKLMKNFLFIFIFSVVCYFCTLLQNHNTTVFVVFFMFKI